METKKAIFLSSAALISIFLFEFADIYSDIAEKDSFWHIAIDSILVLIFVVSATRGWRHLHRRSLLADSLDVENQQLTKQLEVALEQSKGSSLKDAIQVQLKEWRLTKAESEVAMMVIRGLNFFMIADLLQKSERTVRQQAIAIYDKAGFRNRSELTGFFIEMIDEVGDEEIP